MGTGAGPSGGATRSAQGGNGAPLVSVLAITASLCVGWGDALTYGQYGGASIALVIAGVILVWVANWPRYANRLVAQRHVRLGLGVAFSASFVAAIKFRGGIYARGPALSVSVVLVIVAASAALIFVVFRFPEQALASTILLIGGASIAMVIASPAPRIDVWDMYQAVSRGLLHGHNVYTQHWQPHLPGQATIYAYFPGAAVVLAPFYALFGDVRFGVVLALLGSAVLIWRAARNPQSAVFAALLLLYPLLTFSVEQSWSEPLSLLALLLVAWAVRSQRSGWAIVAFAVLLTFQQYDLIFVPPAAAWKDFGWRRTGLSAVLAAAFIAPWALAAPHAFVQGTFTYNVHYAFSFLSLSIFHPLSQVSGVLAYLVLGAGVTVALVAAMRNVHKGGSFLMGCGLVLMTLNIVDKVSRFNEWELAAALVLAAGSEALGSVAVRGAASAPSGDETFEHRRRREARLGGAVGAAQTNRCPITNAST